MSRVYYNLPQVSIRYANDHREMQTYSLNAFRAFMYYVLEKEKLTIAEYLGQMGNNPYFLIAATGLGKTVAAPIHSYLRHCEMVLSNMQPLKPLFNQEIPRLWVVEPKISIAESQTNFMNSLFSDFIKIRDNPNDVNHPTMFGCKTSVHSIHYHAPIKFVTTGIFAIYARLGWLDPKRDCLIIDEAHVTIESSEGVELAIAICRQKGIPIHYMSATVDTQGLRETLGVQSIIEADKQRFPLWMHNTGKTMDHSIVDLVEKTLVYPDPSSEYFPQGNDNVSGQIRDAVLGEGRAKGLLIVVNSFAGEESDANRIAELLASAQYASSIEILLLSGSIIRNAKEKKQFDNAIERIETENKKYVIIATSVVEMGVTFPTLDFVVTMDSGYEQITIGDTVLPEIVPLPVNSMKQRIGRVGRKRPGIGYITNEVGAAYSTLSDYELNAKLPYEQIGLPLRKGSLTTVAQYSFAQEWDDPVLGLADLNLPSGIHKNHDRVSEFLKQRQRLIDIGIAVDNRLTEEGKYCDRWLDAGIDIGFAIKLQQSLSALIYQDVIFYLVACLVSEISLSSLMDQSESIQISELSPGTGDRFNTGGDRVRKGVQLHEVEIEFTPQSEILALYNVVRYFAKTYGGVLFTKGTSVLERQRFKTTFQQDCNACGLAPDRVEAVLKGFATILKTFHDTNWKREEYKRLIGELKELQISDLTFPEITEWDIRFYISEVSTLPNRTLVQVKKNFAGFEWQEVDSDRSGFIKQEMTCVDLEHDQILTAKLIPLPGNQNRKAGEAWRIVHLQQEMNTEEE